jgi:DUF971 family protein
MLAPNPIAVTDHQHSRTLQIDWADGTSSQLPHAYLRASCRCGHCEQLRRTGELPDTDPAVQLVTLEPVGEHGLTLGFSDGHARGIFPWNYLHQLSSH